MTSGRGPEQHGLARRGNGRPDLRAAYARDRVELLCLLSAWTDGDVDETRASRITALVPQIQGWQDFVSLVDQHRVAGLVHTALSRLDSAVPTVIRTAIADRARKIAVANMFLAAEVIRMQRCLEAQGIKPVFFKGVTIANRAYGDLSIKHFKDVDFIVPPTDVQRTISALESMGYAFISPHPPAHSHRWQSLMPFMVEVEMVQAKTRLQVEPHWALDQDNILSIDAMLTRSGKEHASVSGTAIRTFHPDDHFAYLCLHGAKTGWHRLKWLADIYALTRHADDAELQRLVSHAQSVGTGSYAAIALSLCATIFGLSVPRDVLEQAQSGWAQRRLLAFSLASLARSEKRAIFLSPVATLLVAAVQGHPGRELLRWWTSHADVRTFALPRGLTWVYPIIRIPSLLVRISLHLVRG